MALLAVENLEVVYSRAITAVHGVSLSVPQGAIVAVLGTNGAGKSTTLRAISGFLGLDDARVTEGRIRFDGQDIANLPPHRTAAMGIALVPEREKVFPNLTVAENLAAVPSPRPRALMDTVHDLFPRLAGLGRRTAGLLSGGERQMLAIAAGLMGAPRLLMVDELSLGLSPIATAELADSLRRIRRELGLTILLVEQSAAVALSIADHGYVLENGRVVLEGSAERLRGHPDVQEFYLGGSAGGRRSYRDVKQYRRSRRWYG
ncbi:MAG: ABC transporter ATP-binding protein [Paracoccaceae bacterium]|nr:MAG: ABC transporter ATP-binding protein [Paracoccaceae bacterium]